MKINPIIFKSYDIRGIYPSELNEEAAYAIGRAFVVFSEAKNVVVGRDMRIYSPVLFKELVRGITDQGADVFDMGLVPTECLYFAVGNYGYHAGVMITASHNPKDYDGFKMIKKGDKVFSMIRGKDLLETVKAGNFPDVDKKGKINSIDVAKDYIDHALSVVDVSTIDPFKVVVDAGNGMMGKIIPLLQDRLPIEIMPLNFVLDGNFPAHPSNFLEEGATDQIAKKIKEEKADFGFVFDGDGDRVRMLDEHGVMVEGDIALLFLARFFLQKNPGLTVSYPISSSRAVSEMVEKWGGKPVMTPQGFVYVRDPLVKGGGLVSGEQPSSHYCFKDNFYGDSGILAFLYLLKIVSASGKSVSEMVKEVYHYHRIPETNFKVKDKDAIIAKIKEKYSDGRQNDMDGVRIEYDNWWFLVRASNTEPVLRLNIEADTQELLEEKQKELTEVITEK